MVLVTVIISTATFMRNKKSNRILPNRRVRRRQRTQSHWTFRNPFKAAENTGQSFKVEEEEAQEPRADVENVNCNNNVSNVVRHWPPPPPPPPPCAPSLPPPLPPPTGHRPWAVPTVSASVAAKQKKKAAVVSREETVNKALVSELKLRLEQKRIKHQ